MGKTVHEHRAPTDDSIRLVNEMQSKVKDDIIMRMNIDENEVKAVAVLFRPNIASNSVECCIRVILNGKEHFSTINLDRVEVQQRGHTGGNRKIIEHIFEEFSKAIAQELLKEKLYTIMKKLQILL